MKLARACLSTKTALTNELRQRYAEKKAPFGYNGLGEFVYHRSYARTIVDETGVARPEDWHDTVARVVQGTSDMLEQHGHKPMTPCMTKNMFDAMFNMRFLPPGRGLWAMGTAITDERKLYAALNNCAFVSTEDIAEDPAQPFCFLLDASMLGIGVGFDTKGAGKLRINPRPTGESYLHVVADSREGWVDAYRSLLKHYLTGTVRPRFDYALVRPSGAPIKGFGGVSGGPQPLKDLINVTQRILDAHRGKWISERVIVDLMNLIGKAVISGNVRRTAEIAFGSADSHEFMNLKNYKVNPERSSYGWTSNNSIFATLGMDYTEVAHRIGDNGEPGLIWLENMKRYSRMLDPPDNKDHLVAGSNPCVEQTLESHELCCLVETFPMNCVNIGEWLETLNLAFFYAKVVTLGMTPWQRSNTVIEKNRRIGTSISGIAQFVSRHGIDVLRRWCQMGYTHIERADNALSRMFNVPTSIKRTSVKPSGTVSLLAGATPGVHFPISPYYIRRVRVPYNNPLLAKLLAANYEVEPDVQDPNTAVVSFPVFAGDTSIPNLSEVTIWEQFQMAAFMQRYWADNSVSCTVTFDREKETNVIKRCLDHYQYHLKGISILPNSNDVFPQMPYEKIDGDKYNEMMQRIDDTLEFGSTINNEPHVSEYCDNDSCSRL